MQKERTPIGSIWIFSIGEGTIWLTSACSGRAEPAADASVRREELNTASDPTPQVQHDAKASNSRSVELIPLLKQLGPSFYALAAVVLYVAGFLVLNSNLAKSGVVDIEFIDARYFLSGASFVFFLVCFYLFAGRAVLFTPKWLGENLKRVNKDNPRPFWSFVVFIHSFITATFFCCLSAALFTSFAIGSAESALFYAALAGAFFILYTFDVTNLDVKFPRFSETVTIVAKLIAIYAFFAHFGSGAMLTAFMIYITIFAFIITSVVKNINCHAGLGMLSAPVFGSRCARQN